MTKFNGHKNWNHWNVSLWINNDEKLYRTALWYIDNYDTKENAAKAFAKSVAGKKTPDGAPYSYTTIRAAMRGIN